MGRNDTKFKVGDKVRIIDEGKQYSTHETWIRQHAPSYLTKYLANKEYNKKQNYEIVAIGPHIDTECMLSLIVSDDSCILINIKGIELISNINVYIYGNKERKVEVIKILEDLGGVNSQRFDGSNENAIYIISPEKNNILPFSGEYLDVIKHGRTELYLPELKEGYNFKPFEKVLVRDGDSGIWKCILFSHIDHESKARKYFCISTKWEQCIPFERNEHLVGTKNNP